MRTAIGSAVALGLALTGPSLLKAGPIAYLREMEGSRSESVLG